MGPLILLKKRFGQHFLTDRFDPHEDCSIRNIRPDDTIVESVPVRSAHRTNWPAAAHRVIAIEIDKD